MHIRRESEKEGERGRGTEGRFLNEKVIIQKQYS